MHKRLLIIGGVIVLAAVAAALYYYASAPALPRYQPPPQEPPGHGVIGNASVDKDPYDVAIDYTDQGFATTSITIKQGTRVRFLNSSSAQFWPASGVHPTHTLYPEKEPTDCLGSAFDACQGIAPGEFYDFTFYYIGTWPFHDHLQAYNTGTITVVP